MFSRKFANKNENAEKNKTVPLEAVINKYNVLLGYPFFLYPKSIFNNKKVPSKFHLTSSIEK